MMRRRIRPSVWCVRGGHWLAVRLLGCAAGCALLASGCDSAPQTPQTPHSKPNIIWIIWDTVRADRLSLYGYGRKTTPFLDEWARGARVFDNCVTPASTTVPSHASMFTGLLPLQHGASNTRRWLDDRYVTVAERLRDAGYATFAYTENPFITSRHNFTQGFGTTMFFNRFIQDI